MNELVQRADDDRGTVPMAQPRIIHVTGRPGPEDRPALPPGHPVSWGAITCGTVLDGAGYTGPELQMGRALLRG